MLDYIQELDGVGEPVCIIWGDLDHRAPGMSPLGSQADPDARENEVRFTPRNGHRRPSRSGPKSATSLAEVAPSLDHLVGGGQ
jgi:hypothetical protein